MVDKIEKLRTSLIQHGTHSDRIYLMKLRDEDMPGILRDLDSLAAAQGYSKIFAKIPARHLTHFEQHGYVNEARVPEFFRGQEDGIFISRFLNEERQIMRHGNQHLNNLALAEQKWGAGLPQKKSPPGQLLPAGPEHAEEMSRLYAEVFPTYPFPIQDPEYVRQSMRENVAYYSVRNQNRIVALASAEMDPGALNVEMTDFATCPDAAGHGYALFLLDRMEQDMRRRGFPTSYTLARSQSAGMNITFAKLSYIYAGTLVNNTNISGQIESMNVWYKHLNE
jgi:putative beta-lysine N-acetyltransferase